MDNQNETVKRGWLLDQLMLIGHYEAELTHDDEQICNIRHDMAQNSGSLEEIEKLTDELNFRRELESMHYQGRTLAEQGVFDAFPELEIDKKKWCDIKHQCAIYILACETYHARDGHPAAEESMVLAGKQLVFLVSHTFGFGAMDCARCFNDALNSRMAGEVTLEAEMATDISVKDGKVYLHSESVPEGKPVIDLEKSEG